MAPAHSSKRMDQHPSKRSFTCHSQEQSAKKQMLLELQVRCGEDMNPLEVLQIQRVIASMRDLYVYVLHDR